MNFIKLISGRIVIVIAAGLVLIAGIIAAIFFMEKRIPQIEIIEEEEQQEETPPSRAEIIINILAEAYPLRVEKAELRDDDWALLMDGIWYYFAGGKMLPEDLLEKTDEYSGSFGIPNYQRELPAWTEPTPEQAERFRERDRISASSRNNNTDGQSVQRQRSNFFMEGLWQAGSHNTSSRQVISIEFLKKTLVIHRDIAEALSHIEKRIMIAAENDSQVQSWINNIGTMTGWNWRNIAESQSRSYHSYGIAIDILPKSLGGKETYWQWARDRNPEWWNTPYEKRYHPPDAVIKAFEVYGFIWGGKWSYFDTMHFEYRPEVFILHGFELILP